MRAVLAREDRRGGAGVSEPDNGDTEKGALLGQTKVSGGEGEMQLLPTYHWSELAVISLDRGQHH